MEAWYSLEMSGKSKVCQEVPSVNASTQGGRPRQIGQSSVIDGYNASGGLLADELRIRITEPIRKEAASL
jgi:hypothetical protein